MALGLSTKRVKKVAPVDPAVAEQKIQTKMYRLANALKIPPPVNQFKTLLEPFDEDRLLKLFSKYRPENKEEKRKRLESANPKAGPKPFLVKFGLKHICQLIEAKRPKLVLIAADVSPITLVIGIPTLCKIMGISYAFVSSRSKLGALVNRKSSATAVLEAVRGEDSAEFEDLIKMCNGVFLNEYSKHMSTYGGGRINLKEQECLKKETFTN
ncbi:large subunit ribosomal protein L7Ae [Pancytospora epiphaga]|nr:large subunit ribosomal protein L7Ae [Pancytospora epiphaga]